MDHNKLSPTPSVPCRSGIRWMEDGSRILENSYLSARIYPKLGGKIAELHHLATGFQPVFQSRTSLQPAQLYADFSQFDTSGLDDAFPTIIEEDLIWGEKAVRLPDHGEIWSAELSAAQQSQSLVMTMNSRILPYAYRKELYLEEDALSVHYTITNTGTEPFPCHWTFHGLFAYQEDMQFFFPQGAEEVINVTQSSRLGDVGTTYPLPVGTLPDGSDWDFRKVPPAEPASCEKFWLTQPVRQGRCGYLYPHAGMKVLLEYDPENLPYLGCWITAGGFKGEYNCALEPSNGYYDSVACARSNHRCPVLIPGQPWDFTIKIRIVSI